ncbi:DUF1783-domain-containing protein [Sistotremastrum niveocremeum HHB9708]|uniref:DUF1783-domain-containing protein n=2 Tax=Sistotremastraceae TaxID=3402574 RepID=A0A165AJJ8_9AGAM|nr:DUF1783-domain-containing protein [Sistotremastrum niveocremeum HHB9708]KZT44005.1 DUF1783-domain-containing protein [Sistotremastrum suecicum HHB10207 ss-3]
MPFFSSRFASVGIRAQAPRTCKRVAGRQERLHSSSAEGSFKQGHRAWLAGSRRAAATTSGPHKRNMELPSLQKNLRVLVPSGIALGISWLAFLLYSTNNERLSTSIVRQIQSNIKHNVNVTDLVGDNVSLEPAWWMAGKPWISGEINMLRGSIDISVPVKGDLSSGTLYFTSVRKRKGTDFTILRFKIIRNDGVEADLRDQSPKTIT